MIGHIIYVPVCTQLHLDLLKYNFIVPDYSPIYVNVIKEHSILIKSHGIGIKTLQTFA